MRFTRSVRGGGAATRSKNHAAPCGLAALSFGDALWLIKNLLEKGLWKRKERYEPLISSYKGGITGVCANKRQGGMRDGHICTAADTPHERKNDTYAGDNSVRVSGHRRWYHGAHHAHAAVFPAGETASRNGKPLCCERTSAMRDPGGMRETRSPRACSRTAAFHHTIVRTFSCHYQNDGITLL